MDEFLEQLCHCWPPHRWTDSRVLVACSGGPDSMALAVALTQLHPRPHEMAIAHFHHGLRGAEADRDQQFVQHWCQERGFRFFTARASQEEMDRVRRGEGTESAARRLRYQFLVQTAESFGARYLATGHTADDQIETILHHILRGTGLSGLGGMRRVRVMSPAVSLVRPLLECTRQQVIDFLAQRQIIACHDAHNDSDEFLRNRVRHDLLPLLEKEYAPGVRGALQRLGQVATEAQEALRYVADELLTQCLLDVSPQQTTIGCEPLRGRPIHLRRELFVRLWQRHKWPLQAMTLDHWQRLAEMTDDPPRSLHEVLPGSIQAVRQSFMIRLTTPP